MSSIPLKFVDKNDNQIARDARDKYDYNDIEAVGTFRRILPQVTKLKRFLKIGIMIKRCVSSSIAVIRMRSKKFDDFQHWSILWVRHDFAASVDWH